jgi:formylglycine-generating enzyme required for sulfatase activity
MFRRIQLSAGLALSGLLLAAAVFADPPSSAKKDVVRAGPPVNTSGPHQNYTETLEGPDGKIRFEMVAVPGGAFEMGSSNAEADRREDEGPQVKVRLKPFWIGKCEVTWDEFDLYFKIGNTNLEKVAEGAERQPEKPQPGRKLPGAPGPADAVSKPTSPYVDETYGFEREKHPAICMTQHAAMKYCEWLSKKTGKDYRLPTEAEWEYACRAGTTTPHAIAPGENLTDFAWYKQNSRNDEGRLAPHAVGSRKANPWGIHDMHGNVMEWCIDHYVKDAHKRFEKLMMGGFADNPKFAPTENKWAHVARGGHFKDDAKELRSAARRKSEKKWMAADPQEPQSIWWLTNYPIIGFRVCRPVEPDELTGLTSKVVKENDEEFKP